VVTLNKLCSYYLECLDREEIQTYISFPSRIPSPDYAIQEKGVLKSDQLRSELLNEQGKELIRKARMDQTRGIMAGYPVRTRSVNGKLRVEPVLLFEVDQEYRVWWREPQVNAAAIMDTPDGQEPGNEQTKAAVREAAGHFAQNIGILDDEPAPLPRDLLDAIRRHRPDWKLTTEHLAEGLYDRVVLFSTTRDNRFTKGLRKELALLQRKTKSGDIASSALGNWIEETLPGHRHESPAPILEILPMNSEQRRAVDLALSEPLTVVTGPPGTGKSQVIVNLLASAANAGQSVLFASKNRKAVDVVRERFDEQCKRRKVLIRLGNEQEDQISRQITDLLAATADRNAETAYQNKIREKIQRQERIRQLENQESEIISLRNETDALERQSEEARSHLPKEAFLSMTESRIKRMEVEFTRLQRAALRSRKEIHGFATQLLWNVWARDNVFLELHNQAQRTREMAIYMGVPLPEQKPSEENAAAYEEAAETLVAKMSYAKAAALYQEKLHALRNARRIESIHQEKMQETHSQVSTDREIWRSWIDMQPCHMSREERQKLLQFSNTIKQSKGWKSDYQERLELNRQCEQHIRYAMAKMPCWAVTSLSAEGRLPLQSGFFDILVIDEASQCDIASALPLLYRAKRAVIIGDPKQITHICKIRKAEDKRLLREHGLEEYKQWSYSLTSLFDMAAVLAETNIIQLRDHHRSHPDIIEFSNKQFYGETLRVATDLKNLQKSSKSAQPAIRWLHRAGNTICPASGGAINSEEARAVVEIIRKQVVENGYQGTVGVVTPYRKQADRIDNNIAQDGELSQILKQREFISGTAHSFQGDERDLMILSPVISKGAESGTIRWAQEANLLNVAITRARAELIIVGDRDTAESWGNIHKLRLYTADLESRSRTLQEEEPAYRAVPDADLVSDWEKILHKALKDAGIHAIPQHRPENLNYYLDLAVIKGSRRLAIEVDGEYYHKNWDGELCYRDQIRNQRLMSEGWDVMRFWVYEIRDRLDETVEKVKMWVVENSRQG